MGEAWDWRGGGPCGGHEKVPKRREMAPARRASTRRGHGLLTWAWAYTMWMLWFSPLAGFSTNGLLMRTPARTHSGQGRPVSQHEHLARHVPSSLKQNTLVSESAPTIRTRPPLCIPLYGLSQHGRRGGRWSPHRHSSTRHIPSSLEQGAQVPDTSLAPPSANTVRVSSGPPVTSPSNST